MARLLLSTVAAAVAAAAAAAFAPQGPCDIYAADKAPCVAAHSLVRALYGAFDGPLYQVNRTSDGALLDVGVLAAGGFADAAAQDAFCGPNACVVQRIYDQSPNANHLDVAPGGGHVPRGDQPVNATRHAIQISGHKVYGAFFEGGQGYRIDATKGVATGNDPETLLMVTSGTHWNSGCCFDYGNAETNNNDDGKATMECVYYGNSTSTGRGAGSGPWVMADLEQGLWAGAERVNPGNTPVLFPFVTAMVKGGSNGFALKAGDATQAGGLMTKYDGPRPTNYQPMKKQGAIILGIGGDNSDLSVGVFYEGLITAGVYVTPSCLHASACLVAVLFAWGWLT